MAAVAVAVVGRAAVAGAGGGDEVVEKEMQKEKSNEKGV